LINLIEESIQKVGVEKARGIKNKENIQEIKKKNLQAV